jgi:hypothetical protein
MKGLQRPFRVSQSQEGREEFPNFMVLTILICLAFTLGGSSRGDVAALQILRPLSVACLGFGLMRLRWHHLSGFRLPFALFVAAASLPALQLIYLPPDLWAALPGRSLVAEIDLSSLGGLPWRPLTMTPPETLNAFGAMLLPIAVAVLAVQLTPRSRASLLAIPLAIGVAGACLGLAQVMYSSHEGIYLYEITNRGSPVGFFANRNHQAVALACLIPLGTAFCKIFLPSHSDSQVLRIVNYILAFVACAAVLSLVLVTGSRAGLALTIIALASVPFIQRPQDTMASHGNAKSTSPKRWLAISALAFSILVAVAVWLGRDLSIERVINEKTGADLRVQMLPTLWRMLADHLVWGSGLGSFERLYQIYEPAELLAPAYVNHAHNDWLELAITGGSAAIGLVLIACCALVVRAYRILSSQDVDVYQPLRLAGLFCVVILFLASASDYPLRTPYLAGLFVLSILWIYLPMSLSAHGRPICRQHMVTDTGAK